MNQARMKGVGPTASRILGRLQTTPTRQIHNSLMMLNLDDKDSPTTVASQTGQGYAPVQTMNKSPIVQKLWKTRDEAK